MIPLEVGPSICLFIRQLVLSYRSCIRREVSFTYTGCDWGYHDPFLCKSRSSSQYSLADILVQGTKSINPAISLFPNGTPDSPNAQVTVMEASSSLSSDNLSVVVNPNPYRFAFKCGQRDITTCHPKGQFIADVPYRWTTSSASSTTCLAHDISANPHRSPEPPITRYIVQEFNISPGEKFFGFGEQFTPFVKNGAYRAFSLRILLTLVSRTAY